MAWLLPRLVVAVAAALGGGAVGALVGLRVDAPVASTLAGAALGIGLLAVRDALRAARLMRWLRGAQSGPAPRDTGFWGELGYRVERALRLREQRTAEQERRLAQLLSGIEASPNGVLLLDANEQIEWCNRVAADHFGLDPERDLRQRITNLVRAPAFVAYLQGGRWDEPVVYADARGPGTLSVLVRPYGDGRRLVLSQDVTERERAEAMRRDFVANVSHEIRTPLTVLAGFVETMSTLPLGEAERARMLGLMRQQATRMQTLVEDLLVLARLEGSPRPPPDRWVALGPLLERAEGDARELSAGRHRFVAGGSAAGLEIAGAEAELLSAVANLLNNAVRYTPDGGEIGLGVARRGDGAGVVEVRDSGIGIAPEHLPRLAQRFYRIDSSRSRDTGGTGLGLAIVKHVLQRHGGELEIDSAPGRGSRFRLVFPPARVRYREVDEAAEALDAAARR